MVESPLTTADVADIHAARAIGLEIRLSIDGQTIAFDRNGELIGALDVVVVWAARQPAASARGTTDVIGEDGDLQGRVGELTVVAGDLFTIMERTAEITVDAKPVNGVAVAGFRLTSGGGF